MSASIHSEDEALSQEALSQAQKAAVIKVGQRKFVSNLITSAVLSSHIDLENQGKRAVLEHWENEFKKHYFGSSQTEEAERWFRKRLEGIIAAIDEKRESLLLEKRNGGYRINPHFEAKILRRGRNIESEQDFWVAEISELFDAFVKNDIRENSKVERDKYISDLRYAFQLDDRRKNIRFPRFAWLQVFQEVLVLTNLVKSGQTCQAIVERMRLWVPPAHILQKSMIKSTFLLSTFAVSTSFALPSVQVGKPDVDVVVKFPENNPFGRVTNGVSNNLVNLRVTSHSSDPLKVVSVHSQYYESGGKERPLRQSTNMPLALDLPPRGKTPVIPYRFHSENKIGQVGLRVYVDVLDASLKKWTYLGYEGTVEIVEPTGSWFDLELISLYIILTGFFGSIGYLVYKSYILNPSSSTTTTGSGKKRRGPRPNIVAKDSEIRDSAEAVKDGEKVLDQDWIPDHHLRSRNGTKGGKGKEKK
ncbi:hypothetical protein JCM5350_006324 [Sporobolomyces pararoseus]